MTTNLFPDELTLLHNPRCSKSSAAGALLEKNDIAYRERRYLDEPLSPDELHELAQRLGLPAREWVRRAESAYKQAGLDPDSSEAEILAAMAGSPILIERPILVTKARAVVGRPPERIFELVG
ncbi:MAG: arsenate reductase (glutaredoxin) [Deltaproteobacteria bacterium]|nr:arsenate reductase (glutaredoxin) [Deltaproteobacteria bacterium]